MARPLNKAAQAILEILVRRLEVAEARTIDTAPGIMAVHVDRLSERRYALAHRYEQNGDSMADPDMEFYRAQDGAFYACTFQQDNLGLYRVGLEISEDGQIQRQDLRIQADLTGFAGTWLRNIRVQQTGYFHIEALLDRATMVQGGDGQWSACGPAIEAPLTKARLQGAPPVVVQGETRKAALAALRAEMERLVAWQRRLLAEAEEHQKQQAQQG